MKMLQLTNTLSGKIELFKPLNSPKVLLYVCGITPYDYAHIGHGRVYVTFDMLFRLLSYLGYEVTYCRNFTDIDDKLMARAQKEYDNELRFKEIADFYINAYQEDMKALDCQPPTYQPCVTDNIDAIILFIKELINAGKAYVVDGDVYYSIKTFPSYGKLSKRNIDDLLAGARVAVNEKKKDPLDFALWKSESEGAYWQSPWGWGRPGWHIECSALARLYLGDTIDIHGGGMDLIFPHHENEIAQTEGLTDLPFARLWMHNAFVRINQEKMSKSLGNFFTLKDVFKEHDPMVVRFLYLQHQYRNPLDFSFEELVNARKTYQRLCTLLEGSPVAPQAQVKELPLDSIPQRMLDFLLHDLNTPGMFGVVFENIKAIQEDPRLKAQVKMILKEILGLELQPLEEKKVTITPEIEALLAAREEARAKKDWAQSDALRDQLKALGVEVQDKKV
jgi:cysteinyl-tRNA synthetase